MLPGGALRPRDGFAQGPSFSVKKAHCHHPLYPSSKKASRAQSLLANTHKTCALPPQIVFLAIR